MYGNKPLYVINPMYGEPTDEEFLFDEDVMDHAHFMANEEDELEYTQADCCLKETVKNYVKIIAGKSLTNAEALLICLYQFAIVLVVITLMIQFHCIAYCLAWVSMGFISDSLIFAIALFMNTMFMIQLFCEIFTIVKAFLCKCM